MKIFKNREDKLYEAVKNGILDDVINYLQNGADVNAKDALGMTPRREVRV
jgi:ankyrin repeat protein